MRIEIKLTGTLYNGIMRDLARPHPFAAERAGFVCCRMGSLCGSKDLLSSSADIIQFRTVNMWKIPQSARGSTATLLLGQCKLFIRVGQNVKAFFTFHVHGHRGEPGMSFVDSRDLPKLISGFQSVGHEAVHGIIIFEFKITVQAGCGSQPAKNPTMSIALASSAPRSDFLSEGG